MRRKRALLEHISMAKVEVCRILRFSVNKTVNESVKLYGNKKLLYGWLYQNENSTDNSCLLFTQCIFVEYWDVCY